MQKEEKNMCRELSWDTLTKLQADALLQEWIEDKKEITSLDFKLELRRRVNLIEPRRRNIVQEDIGYWLREKDREDYWESVGYELLMRDGYFAYAPEKLYTFPDLIDWLKVGGWSPCDDALQSDTFEKKFFRNGVGLSLKPFDATIRTYRYSGELTMGPWVCNLGDCLDPEALKKELLIALTYLPDPDVSDEKIPQEIDEVHEEVDPFLEVLDMPMDLDFLDLDDAVDDFKIVPFGSEDWSKSYSHPNA
jgi:hypothetical protein